jgi:hypothetical protein
VRAGTRRHGSRGVARSLPEVLAADPCPLARASRPAAIAGAKLNLGLMRGSASSRPELGQGDYPLDKTVGEPRRIAMDLVLDRRDEKKTGADPS